MENEIQNMTIRYDYSVQDKVDNEGEKNTIRALNCVGFSPISFFSFCF